MPKWSLEQQSRAGALSDLAQASTPAADVSRRHHVNRPFCTLVRFLHVYNCT